MKAMDKVDQNKTTPIKAKSLLKKWLDENKVPYRTLSARTVGFSDLARDKAIFVKVFGWVARIGNDNYSRMIEFSRKNGFIVETDKDF